MFSVTLYAQEHKNKNSDGGKTQKVFTFLAVDSNFEWTF